MTPRQVRDALRCGDEIALVDVREEAPYAEGHPLFAANLPLSRLELQAHARIPRRDTPIVVYDGGEGLAARAARRFTDLGYADVKLLDGGLAGWRASGGEMFIDVNVPSKAFGELVESRRHTPSLSADEVKALLDARADIVVLDARREDEYRTMNIPGSISVPGAELVLRARSLAPDPATRIVVNCAGRTRSIIGTQSLVNAGVPNPVCALRNGTIGWTLAGHALEHGADRRYPSPAPDEPTAARARAVADRAHVGRATRADLARWQAEPDRTTYLLDVRTPAEYAAGHLPGAQPAPGGQLVQETDHVCAVRGARVVVVDDGRNVRADMTASWLAQMGWDVHVLDGVQPGDLSDAGAWNVPLPPATEVATVDAPTLAAWHARGDAITVFDLAPSASHVRRHLPGARWVLRSEWLAQAQALGTARCVLTCDDGTLARYAAADAERGAVHVLAGGTAAWAAAGLPIEAGDAGLLSPRIDRYRRPYEGTDNAAAAMQAYLDWEYGLVDQLARDGTHGFFVI